MLSGLLWRGRGGRRGGSWILKSHHSVQRGQCFIVSRRSQGRRRPGWWTARGFLGGRRGQRGLARSLWRKVAPHGPIFFDRGRLRTKWEGQVHGPIVRHQSLLFLRRLLVGSRPVPPDDCLWSGSHGDGGHRIRWSDGKGQVHDPVGRRSQVSGRLLVRPISSFLWPERYLLWRQHGPCSWWLRRPTAADHLRVRIHAASRP